MAMAFLQQSLNAQRTHTHTYILDQILVFISATRFKSQEEEHIIG